MSDSGTLENTPPRRRFSARGGFSSFLLISLALHIPLFVYPLLRLGAWLDAGWVLTVIVSLPLVFSQVIARMYLRNRRDPLTRRLRQAADLFLGMSPILLFSLLIMEVPVLLGLIAPVAAAQIVISITLGCTAFGIWSAAVPAVRTVTLTSDKLDVPLRFAQITDVHIGSRDRGFLERVIAQVNELNPDFLCITGDFIDATGVPEADLRSLKSVVGPTYFCIGNHEKYEDLEDILDRLRHLGVVVLRNAETRFRENVQVLGIDDMDDAGQVGRELARMELDSDSFVLLLYHRPRGLVAAAEAGVDLMISGHTHNGQIIPFNLIVRRVFDMTQGLYSHGRTNLYVSQGTGTWGPVMRFGTRSEITLFEIHPEPSSAEA